MSFGNRSKQMGNQPSAQLTSRATYTVEEVASLLGIGRTCAYRALRLGHIPSIRIGKRYVVPRAAIGRWLGSIKSKDPADVRGTLGRPGALDFVFDGSRDGPSD